MNLKIILSQINEEKKERGISSHDFVMNTPLMYLEAKSKEQ